MSITKLKLEAGKTYLIQNLGDKMFFSTNNRTEIDLKTKGMKLDSGDTVSLTPTRDSFFNCLNEGTSDLRIVEI